MDLEKRAAYIHSFFLEIVNTTASIFKVIFKWGFRDSKIPKIDSDTCIILGNGPSLSDALKEHPSILKNHPLFCVNGFSLTPEYTELKPTNYVLLDPVFWKDKDNKAALDMINNLITKTQWNLNLFIPYPAHKYDHIQNISKTNPHIKTIFINYIPFKGFKKIAYFFFSKNWAMPQCQNVVAASLYIAIVSNVKNIYLLGADHDWHKNVVVTDKNELIMEDKHFYGNKTVNLSSTPGRAPLTMAGLYLSLTKLFTEYEVMQAYSITKRIAIYNASTRSYVDTFRRKSLSDIEAPTHRVG